MTVTELAHVAVDANGQMGPQAIRLFVAVSHVIFMLTDGEMLEMPAFSSDEDHLGRIRALGAKLSTTAARELAYATAHLLILVDNQLAPAENEFLEMLRTALDITEMRADELAAQLGAAITPTQN